MHRHDDVLAIAANQHGLIRTSQLVELGVPSGSLAHAVSAGHLERLSERVLRIGGSAPTSDQLAMAAALDVPGGAVAVYSAAALWQLPGFDLEPVHVLTARSPHRGGQHLGIVHTSVHVSPADVMELRGIPITSPLRTLCDLAGRLHQDRLDLLCERMLAKRLLRVAQLHEHVARLPRRGGARGTAAIRRLALERGDDHRPVESGLEHRFQSILRDAGEQPFERQVDLGDDDGWIGRVDFVDHPCRLIAEVQSELFHSGRVDRARDDVRNSRFRRAGWTLLEIREFDIWHRPDRVVATVRDARRAARRRAQQKGGSPDAAGRSR
jgi:very-short-patch-repair endonuclease